MKLRWKWPTSLEARDRKRVAPASGNETLVVDVDRRCVMTSRQSGCRRLLSVAFGAIALWVGGACTARDSAEREQPAPRPAAGV